MINASDAFKRRLEDGNPLLLQVETTFLDGSTETFDTEIMAGGNVINDGAGSSSFPVGAAICKNITIQLDNSNEQYKEKDFFGAKMHAYLAFDDETVGRIDKGVFTVTNPEEYGDVITLTGYDDMYKADREYTTKLSFPQTVYQLVKDACGTLGIAMGFSYMTHGSFLISSVPQGTTFREFLGMAAMIECANARLDTRGYLQFRRWNFSNEEKQEYEDFVSSPTFSTSDISITGVQVKNGDKAYLSGKTGYVLEFENALVPEESLQTVASWLGTELNDVTFRSMEGELADNPLVEFGDVVCSVDRRGNKYTTPITDVTYSCGDCTTIKTQADDPVRGKRYRSAAGRALVEARQLVEKERTDREKAQEKMSQTIRNANGMYATREEQPDGSVIYYLHDKKTLAESETIMKITQEVIGVSNDGGKTYPYGFALNGETITRLLYAEGINADYIDAGALTVRDKDRNVIFQADVAHGSVIISADSVRIGDRNVTQAMQEITNSMASVKNMTMQLSNQYAAIPVKESGTYSKFPADVTTRPTVMYGSQDITEDCAFSWTKSDSVDGTWNASTRTYKVTGLSADTGWVDIKATYLNTLSVVQRFSIAKLYQGIAGNDGANGVDGRSYTLETSTQIIKTITGEFHSPASIKFSAYYRDGAKASRQAYSGRFKIEETTDGSAWTTVYTSASDETTVTRSIDYLLADDDGTLLTDDDGKIIIAAQRQIYGMRCTLYAAGETTTIIDTERVPVVKTVESLSQEEIFDILTNRGAAKGLFMEGNQLYISFTYARGGCLALGGPNNGRGYMYIYDEDGNRVGSWTKDGITAEKGTFAGNLSGAKGTFAGALSAATGTFKGTVTAGNITGSDISGSAISGSSFETKNTSGTAKIDIEKATQKFYSNAAFDAYAGEIHPNTNKTLISYINASGEQILSEEEVSGLDVSANYLLRMLVHGTELARMRQDRAFVRKFLEITGGLSTTGSGSIGGALEVAGNENVKGKLTGAKNFEFAGNGLVNTIKGSLVVYGNISQNVTELSDTENTPVTLTYNSAYPSPVIADVGTGKTGSDGTCYVAIDNAYVQSASDTIEYVAFLQAEGEGTLYIAEKQADHFIVRGTPDLKFAWEIKSAKKGTEIRRYDDIALEATADDSNEEELIEIADSDLTSTEGLESIALQELAHYDTEMEEIYESIKSISGD